MAITCKTHMSLTRNFPPTPTHGVHNYSIYNHAKTGTSSHFPIDSPIGSSDTNRPPFETQAVWRERKLLTHHVSFRDFSNCIWVVAGTTRGHLTDPSATRDLTRTRSVYMRVLLTRNDNTYPSKSGLTQHSGLLYIQVRTLCILQFLFP